MLICPVRGCRQPVTREDRRMICPQGHSFDIARSGYMNLLQPQDRRSAQPGDSAAAVASRRRLHDAGVSQPLFEAIREMLAPAPGDMILDSGCGDGFYLGSLATASGCTGYGIDISVPAIDAAARRYPGCEWIVANADRFIPYADETFSAIVSITARMNPGEFRRVIRPDGPLLIAVPAPDDLIELRGAGRDRSQRTVEEFAPQFQLIRQERITSRADLDEAALQDVLLSIYRPMRSQPLEAVRVTFSLDLLLFRAG